MSSDLTLSIIIPAYNEEKRIIRCLSDILDNITIDSFEIIVVSDGSVDRTKEVIEDFARNAAESRIRVIEYQPNQGKGYAVKMGMLAGRGRYLIYLDADGATPFKEFDKLFLHVENGKFDVAIGSRALISQDSVVVTKLHRKILGRIFNSLVNILIVPKIADTQCGFKLFSNTAAQTIFNLQKIDGFSFDVELLFLARKNAFKISEIPINWTNIEGSKVRLGVDSAKMFFEIFKIRLNWILRKY